MRNDQPPSTARAIGEHSRRLGALEREKNTSSPTEWEDVGTGAGTGGGGGGGGIQFDTYPQAGNWLYVETTNATGSPAGFDIELKAAGDVGIFPAGSFTVDATHGNITIEADDGSISINADTTNLSLNAGNWLQLYGQTLIALNSPGSIGIESPLINIGGGAGVPGSIVYDASGASSVSVTSGITTLQATSQLVFYSPSQQTTCTTLSDVIALLVSYGLAV